MLVCVKRRCGFLCRLRSLLCWLFLLAPEPVSYLAEIDGELVVSRHAIPPKRAECGLLKSFMEERREETHHSNRAATPQRPTTPISCAKVYKTSIISLCVVGGLRMTNSTEYTKAPQAAHMDGGATLAIITPYSDSRAQKEFAKARTSLNDHMRYDGIIGLSQKEKRAAYLKNQAMCLFLDSEVALEWMFENERLQRNQGTADTFFVGTWKHAPQHGLHVIASEDSIGLRSQGDVWYLQWAYEWRPDQKERGFIEIYDHVSLDEISKIHNSAERFTQTLEGYLTVASARPSLP